MKSVIRAAIASGMVAGVLALTATPAQAVERDVEFENDCPHPVRVLVAHAYAADTWDAHGWYEFSANEESTQLTDDNDEPLLHLDDEALFIYAESTDDADIFWEGEEHYETFGDVRYGMKKAVLEVVSGDLHIRLTCEGY
jgi:hypothetical protein